MFGFFLPLLSSHYKAFPFCDSRASCLCKFLFSNHYWLHPTGSRINFSQQQSFLSLALVKLGPGTWQGTAWFPCLFQKGNPWWERSNLTAIILGIKNNMVSITDRVHSLVGSSEAMWCFWRWYRGWFFWLIEAWVINSAICFVNGLLQEIPLVQFSICLKKPFETKLGLTGSLFFSVWTSASKSQVSLRVPGPWDDGTRLQNFTVVMSLVAMSLLVWSVIRISP